MHLLTGVKRRWDSSDPERAPPPLPLNPGTGTPTSKPNTSASIAAAAKAIVDRVRESTPSSYTTNQMGSSSPERSPEKSLIKGAQHKRMQSLQTTSVKDLRSYLDGRASPEKSPERPSSKSKSGFLGFGKTPSTEDVFTSGQSTPTRTPGDLLKDSSPIHPSSRPILRENTPPSATMLALQTMRIPDGLHDITNGPTTPGTPSRVGLPMDLTSQLHHLTNIATNLQKEMAGLSRRSKDNATDLISLKEATSQRDEDIRRSLRELSTHVTATNLLGPPPLIGSRCTSSLGGNFLDGRAFNSPPSAPRAASVGGFDERVGSPSPYSIEGAASVAMLEKIVREMVTKEGQDRLLSTLSELLDKSRKDNVDAAKKVEELAEFIKEKSHSQSLVKHNSRDAPNNADISFGSPVRVRGQTDDEPFVGSEEVMKMLQRIKDSIAHSGGTTSEVKGLVRDLRGEILGMGRELGRKLDAVVESQPDNSMALERSMEPNDRNLQVDDVQRIVMESMAELKEQVSQMLRQRAEQDDDTFKQLAMARSGPDGDEMFAVVKHALAEHGNNLVQHDSEREMDSSLDRDGVLEAVKEGLKDFEPNIELQQFGLERDEILAVLKEGLEDYQNNKPEPATSGIDKGEVYEAMQEALKDFSPAFPVDAIAQIKEELVENVRIALEDHTSSFRGSPIDVETTRSAIMESVKESFANHAPAQRELEINRDDLFEAVKASWDGSVGSFGEQVLQQMHGLIEGMRTEFQQYSAANGRDTEQVLDAVKDGLESLRAEIEQYVDRAQDVTGKDEIVDTVRGGLEQLRVDIQGYCAQGPVDDGKEELLDYVKSEFEHLHETLEAHQSSSRALSDAQPHNTAEIILAVKEAIDGVKTHVTESSHSRDVSSLSSDELAERLSSELDELKAAILNANAADKGELIETIQDSMGALHSKFGGSELSHVTDETVNEILDTLEEIKTATAKGSDHAPVPDELLEAMRGEFENLRNSIATSVVHGGNNEEVLDAMRLGLDDLRSHLEKKLDNPEQNIAHNNEMLDAINEGLETLRADVIKTLDKPLDMTVNYEILDTLKDGLASVRADLDSLKDHSRPLTSHGGAIVLAEGAEIGQAREISPDDGPVDTRGATGGSTVENMEVLIQQLQIKIEALDETVHDLGHKSESVDESGLKDDLMRLEAMIRIVQDSMTTLAEKDDGPAPEGAARKEDTDAIETLLRNTKARLEEMAHPDGSTAASKDHLDTIEAVIRVTNEAIDSLADKIENSTAAKADVAVVEVLAQDMKTALDELKEKMPSEFAEQVTKADFDVLGMLCTEIKTKVEEMELQNSSEMPSKADMEQLQALIADFRESHDKMKDSYETDIAVTAKAFDDRKKEFEETVEHITAVKDELALIKEDLLTKMGDGETGINALGVSIKALEEKTGGQEPVIDEVKRVMEALTREFERAHDSLDLIKGDQESVGTKQAEHKEEMISQLSAKLDDLFDGLMSKYDDAQHAAEDNVKAMLEKSVQQEDLLNSTKEMTDDLKLSIDTLGSAMTVFTATFPEQVDKMAEDSKTVFNRVDDTWNKLDETNEGLKYEHTLTRDEVAKAMKAIGDLHSDIGDHNPRFMVTLQEVQALIGRHFEHSEKATETAAQHHQLVRELSDQLKAGFEETKTRHLNQTEELKSALPALLPASDDSEKYDDTLLHEKLDKLLDHSKDASQSSNQIERLDQIHEKVMATAAEVSAFVATQTKQITAEHENKERETEELALLLERRLVQRDEIEDDITVLNEEKDSLRSAVEALKAEKAALTAQKARLQADVSSLETALHIRRDELHDMDHKAETIERRIMEGVMNQSRLLLLSKSTKPAPKKKPQGRDLRIPSDASAVSGETVTSSVPGLKAGHAIAMRSRPSIAPNAQRPNTPQRRIMSLNQISQNQASPSQAYSSAASSLVSNSSRGINRRHSVKPNLLRDSWAGKRNVSISSQNKENEDVSEDDDEGDDHSVVRGGHDDESERRESAMTFDDGRSYTEDGTRMSYGGHSEYSYGTGSYMTGSEIDRRESITSSADGQLGRQSVIDEEPEGTDENPNDETEAHEPLRLEGPRDSSEKAPYHSSDSGIGTSVPSDLVSSRSG
ncbi:Chromosome segregation atpase [Acrodontium crateriforme]|uniref:Chromosome segregation atpase n=1 Tax=Acrodontium crateriforme TaxID=150365 RepID=A0AAQ3M3E9_9PEZI|nr:Chromosome segregation atpase [Acrodontium crateriforme]